MVARMRLIIKLYVHCLSCLLIYGIRFCDIIKSPPCSLDFVSGSISVTYQLINANRALQPPYLCYVRSVRVQYESALQWLHALTSESLILARGAHWLVSLNSRNRKAIISHSVINQSIFVVEKFRNIGVGKKITKLIEEIVVERPTGGISSAWITKGWKATSRPSSVGFWWFSVALERTVTVMTHIRNFRSTMDRIYDGGHIRIIIL
jgi:hypothetical protein